MDRSLKQKSDYEILQKICFLYVVVITSVYLLAVPFKGYVAIAEFKYKLFLWVSLPFIAIMCLIWLELKLVNRKEMRFRQSITTPVWICAVLYLVFAAISGGLSKYPGVFFGNGRNDGLLTIGVYVAVFLLLFRFFKPSTWMLHIFAASTTLFCVFGIIQLLGANPLGLYPLGYCFYDAGIYYAGEYWSTIGNTDICASFLALSLGILAAAMIRNFYLPHLLPLGLCVFCIWEVNVASSIFAMLLGLILLLPVVVDTKRALCNALFTYGFILLVTAIAFAITFSREGAILSLGTKSAVAGLVALILILAGIIVQKIPIIETAAPKTIRISLLLFVIGILLFAALFLYFYNGFLSGFLQEAHEVLRGNLNDNFGSGRIYIWKQVWAKVKEHWLFGGGPDTLSFRGIEGFSRYSTELGILIESKIDVAHNEYLNILVNQGILSFLVYLGILALSFKNWWLNATEETEKAIAGAGVLFYCIQAFFGISMCINSLYLWIALAMLNIKTTQTKKET